MHPRLQQPHPIPATCSISQSRIDSSSMVNSQVGSGESSPSPSLLGRHRDRQPGRRHALLKQLPDGGPRGVCAWCVRLRGVRRGSGMFGGRMLARVARNFRAPRVAVAAAGAAAAAGVTLYTAPPAQANPSIGEMLTTIAAKVDALETKMAASGTPATGFGSFDMAGKCIIITGGASGIGYGMCELFSQRGSKVFCLDLFPEAVKKAEDALGPNVRVQPAETAVPPSSSRCDARWPSDVVCARR